MRINLLKLIKEKSDYLLIFENEHQIQNIEPNIPEIAKINARGIIVSSISENFDFVSRFFGPNCGVNEDPVTGSAHTTLTPFWAEKLGKTETYCKTNFKTWWRFRM